MSDRLRLAALGLWLGAASAWSLVFLPTIFAKVPPTGLAASLVGASLWRIDQAGLLLALAALGLGLAGFRSAPGTLERIRLGLPILGVFCHALSLVWLLPEIQEIREAAGGAIANLAPDHPDVARFASLHGVSFGVFTAAASTALLVLIWDLAACLYLRPGGRSP